MPVISVNPIGIVTALFDEKSPLDFLGEQKIRRACDIVWQDEKQAWALSFTGCTHIPMEYTGFKTYSEAREAEVAILERCLVTSDKPDDASSVRWFVEWKKREGA